MKFPFVRRSRLTRAMGEANGLRHSLTHNADEARRREQVAREKVHDDRHTLIASVVADYYRALAAVEDRPGRTSHNDPFIDRQFGLMDHSATLLARLTGKDRITITFLLDQGLPVAGEPRVTGDADERRETLTTPYRRCNAGVYAHLAPEENGPRTPERALLDAAWQRGLGIDLGEPSLPVR